MPIFTRHHLLAVSLAAACAAAHAADVFVPPGAKATLSVDYVYESAGKKRSEGLYDPYEWRVKRTASLTADLAAQPATAMPTVQAIDAAQMAGLTGKVDKAQGVATQMAPMMADAEKIMAKCGDNEACITREAQKMGAAMQGTPQMAEAMKAKKGIDELSRQDAPRYQAWRPTAQRGTYLIDETVHISSFDLACPRQRCTRDETRKGSGEITLPQDAKRKKGEAASLAAVELDAGKNTLTVTLPAPLLPLPITETITTNEPKGETPTPKGPQPKLQGFRVNAAGGYMHEKPFTVPLKGGWRTQSGEQVMNLKGNFGDAGKLTVRWRFTVL
jgi:hypothetical protein